MNGILDLLDEITILTGMLNRMTGREDYSAAYSIARTLSIKLSTFMDAIYLEMLQRGEIQ